MSSTMNFLMSYDEGSQRGGSGPYDYDGPDPIIPHENDDDDEGDSPLIEKV